MAKGIKKISDDQIEIKENEIIDENQPSDKIQILFDEIGKLMEDKGIKNALLLLEDPDSSTDGKRMFFRGEFYEVAKLAAAGSRVIKQKISEDLRDL